MTDTDQDEVGGSRPAGTPSDLDAQDAGPVRPYVMTGGRTRSVETDLPMETVVQSAPAAASAPLDFERRAIADTCARPQSIAELSGRLGIPLGVTRVLVSDMTAEGLLTTHGAVDPSDPDSLRRLQEGIRAL